MMTTEQKRQIDEYMRLAPPLDDESWSDVVEHNGYEYRISSKGYVYKMPWAETMKNGKIRHKKGFLLRPLIDRIGTLRVDGGLEVLHNVIYSYYKGEFKAQAFRIRHKDGNKFNNDINNLYKETAEEIFFDADENLSEKEYLQKYYRITTDGRVFRKSDGVELKACNGPKNYMIIRLKAPKFSKNKDRRKPYKIHRLVAMFYLDDYSDDLQVNHINGNKHDNRVDNLEMVTNQENVIHAYKYLDSSYRRHVLSERNSTPVIEITTGRKFKSQKEAAIVLGVNPSSISFSVLHGRVLQNGYRFKYVDKQ